MDLKYKLGAAPKVIDRLGTGDPESHVTLASVTQSLGVYTLRKCVDSLLTVSFSFLHLQIPRPRTPSRIRPPLYGTRTIAGV